MLPVIAALLAQGMSLLGNAVMTKGQDWLEEKTGVKLGPAMTSEDLVKLKQFELAHEVELLKLQQDDDKLSLEVLQVEAADRKDARAREVSIEGGRAGLIWWQFFSPSFTSVLALLVVLGGGWLFYELEEPSTRMAISNLITGVLMYYFGNTSSSHGMGKLLSQSMDKDGE
jgi:hypothetical protein